LICPDQLRDGDFPISDVMVDVLGESVSSFVQGDVFKHARLPQLVDNVVSFRVGVGIRGMCHLESQLSKRKSGILCTGTDPKHAVTFVGAIGVEPETCRIDIGFNLREALGPKADVMPLTRAVINRPLKANVLASSEKIEGAERGSRVWLV